MNKKVLKILVSVLILFLLISSFTPVTFAGDIDSLPTNPIQPKDQIWYTVTVSKTATGYFNVPYYYVVTAVDYSGNKSGFSQKVFTIVADVKSGAEIPTVYKLGQNYPNPFNPSTTIKYSIPSNKTPLMRGVVGVFVTLKIYDILGREVETLVNEQQKAGNYEVNFDASTLSSGIYFYRLQSYSFVESKKMILIK